MPKQITSASPLSQETDLVSYNVLFNGQELEEEFAVESIDIYKEVNKIATAEIVIWDGEMSEENFKLLEGNKLKPGNDVKINLGYHQKNETVFEGIIVGTGVKVKIGNHSAVVVYCADKAIKMTMGRKNKYFLKVKDSDVFGQIIGNHGLQKDVKSTSYKHKEIIQYHCTDWDFLVSRAEINGLIVITNDNKVLVKEPEVSGSSVLTLTYGLDILKTDITVDARHQIKSVVCASWDMSSQKMVEGKSSEPSVNDQGSSAPFDGKKLADVMSSDDFLLHATGPLESADLKNWANARLLKSRLAQYSGSVKFQGSHKAIPNCLIEIKGLGDYLNGNAFVSAIHHEVSEGNWTTEAKVGLNPDWFIETKPNISFNEAKGVIPGIDGLYNGKVKKIESDPDGETRIQVDVPVIEPSGDGVWARMAHLYATNKAGSFFIPEVGDEVLLGFLNNDPRFPVILGMMYSKKNAPPYTPDKKNSIKAFVTKNQLKMVFEDEKKNIIIETPAKNIITISDENKKITIEDQNKNKIEMSQSGIVMDSPKDIKIKAKGKIDIEAMQNITVKSSAGDISSQGLNVKSKANIQFSAQGTMAELKGSAQTTVKGGIVMIN